MNRDFNYTELIEDYLVGNLSEKERLEFENQLNTDPLLRKEFQLQEDIIGSIRNVRKAELKSMLNNVQVSTGPGPGLFSLKLTAGLIGAAILGVGTYFYVNREEKTNENNIEIVDDSLTAEEENNGSAMVPKETTPEVGILGKGENGGDAVTSNEETTDNPEPTVIEKEPILDTETDNTIAENKETEEVAKEGLTSDKNPDAFHYQFNDNKLYLYGDFKGIPYDIITLTQDSSEQLFMYYNQKYYYLDQNQKSIKPFKLVEDSVLIKQLEDKNQN